MTRHATAAPCAKCPFRMDVPIYLRLERRQEIAQSLHDGNWFPCHATVSRDDEGEAILDDGLECAGAIKALHAAGGTTQMTRIAERLGMLDLDQQVESGAEVWDLNTWMTLAEGATGDDPEVDDEAEVETCSVSYSGCRAPAGWLGSGGGVMRGTVAADGTCEACGEPVCSNCRHGEDGPCFGCLDEDEDWDGRSIV